MHEAFTTLERMNSAANYNAWLGRKIRPHLGRRVLEIGAGLGTITDQIQHGRELVIALEIEQSYVDKLRERFNGNRHVRPSLSSVERADWIALRGENIDSVVHSNVLEHIRDDVDAVGKFREVLRPGGNMVCIVPALPALHGSLDDAVGHYRRYTPDSLRSVLEKGGFRVETLEWMNLLGIPGWFLNSVVLRRRTMPPLQLRLYDRIAPVLASLEAQVRVPIGMSLFAVARAE